MNLKLSMDAVTELELILCRTPRRDGRKLHEAILKYLSESEEDCLFYYTLSDSEINYLEEACYNTVLSDELSDAMEAPSLLVYPLDDDEQINLNQCLPDFPDSLIEDCEIRFQTTDQIKSLYQVLVESDTYRDILGKLRRKLGVFLGLIKPYHFTDLDYRIIELSFELELSKKDFDTPNSEYLRALMEAVSVSGDITRDDLSYIAMLVDRWSLRTCEILNTAERLATRFRS